jgi:hypothetical protein
MVILLVLYLNGLKYSLSIPGLENNPWPGVLNWAGDFQRVVETIRAVYRINKW